jgi:hypothetical protein
MDGQNGYAGAGSGLSAAKTAGSETADVKLTADEIKLIVFVLLALLVGAAAKHYRHAQPIDLPPRAPHVTPAPTRPVDYE